MLEPLREKLDNILQGVCVLRQLGLNRRPGDAVERSRLQVLLGPEQPTHVSVARAANADDPRVTEIATPSPQRERFYAMWKGIALWEGEGEGGLTHELVGWAYTLFLLS